MVWENQATMALPEFREAVGFENLKHLQRIADEHVDHMKEGTYLEVCGHHKSLYDEINALVESNTKLYDLWQAEKNRVNVPFQPRVAADSFFQDALRAHTDPIFQDALRAHTDSFQARLGLPLDPGTFARADEEWEEHLEVMTALRADLAVADRSLRNLKPIVRITQRIKESAIEDFCKGDPRGVGHGPWTWQNLIRHYESMFWFETETEHNNFVSGLNERQIYQDYKRRMNERVERATQEAQALKSNLEGEIARIGRRLYLLNMAIQMR